MANAKGFFEERLAAFLERRYGREIPIVFAKDQSREGPFIHAFLDYEGGDIYSGTTTHHQVVLSNFTRPDGTRLEVQLSYTFHELSGQMDYWDVVATGVRPDEEAELLELCRFGSYDVHAGVGLRPTVTFDGVKR